MSLAVMPVAVDAQNQKVVPRTPIELTWTLIRSTTMLHYVGVFGAERFCAIITDFTFKNDLFAIRSLALFTTQDHCGIKRRRKRLTDMFLKVKAAELCFTLLANEHPVIDFAA